MLYDKIKQVAKEKGIPICKLESECEMSQGSICKWNNIVPSSEKVAKVANRLGVSTDCLLKEYIDKAESSQ
jgi:galactitol-specific phosphotransferase system IIB component